MADNVNVTPGAGNVIAADEVIDATLGTVKAQYVKLMSGTLDDTTKIAAGHGSAANALRVELANDGQGQVALVAGQSIIVSALPQNTTKIGVTPTVTASTYAVNKVIGGIMLLSNLLSATAPYSGILSSLCLKFKGSVQTVGFYVALFDASPSGTFTDTSTAAIAANDSAHLIGIWHLVVPYSVLGTHTIYNLDGIVKAINGVSANLYAVVVPDATTAALGSTSDMTLEVGVLQG